MNYINYDTMFIASFVGAIVFWLVCGLITDAMKASFLLGFLLGPLGILIALFVVAFRPVQPPQTVNVHVHEHKQTRIKPTKPIQVNHVQETETEKFNHWFDDANSKRKKQD